MVDARSHFYEETLVEMTPLVEARFREMGEPPVEVIPSSVGRGLRETASSIGTVVSVFAAEAKRLLDHDRLSLYMLTDDSRAFERFAVATSAVLAGETDVIRLEDTGLIYVLQTNQALVADDLASDGRLIGQEDQVIAAAGFHGLVSVPLHVRDVTIGVLNFVSKTKGFYSEDDALVAQQLADEVAVFLQNLRLEERNRLLMEREAVQEERKRLTREVHATVAEPLAEMLVKLELIGTRLGGLDDEAHHQIEAVRGQGETVLSELRGSLLRMQPAELEGSSLEEAMAAVLAELDEEHGFKTSLEFHGPVRTLPTPVVWEVLRIFQEAVRNIRKHSEASSIAISLRVGEGLMLSIEDNGRGFIQASREGLGLSIMRERAEEIGGHLNVSSVLGRGTTVLLTVPTLPSERPVGAPSRNHGFPVNRPRVARVLVVDSHPLFRDAVSRLLQREADLRVVAEVGTGREALMAIKRLRPDVLLLGVNRQDTGIEFLRELARLGRTPPTLVLSAFPEDGYVLAAMKAGARGYLAKTIDGGTLIQAIRMVMRGVTVFDLPEGLGPRVPRQFVQLTTRELDVISFIASGKTNAEIGDELSLAEKTVERVVATTVMKLRARNRSHAVAKAVALKIVELPTG